MKNEFELTKNKIILGLICVIILLVALVSIPKMIRWENKRGTLKTINSDVTSLEKRVDAITKAIYDLQSENEMLVIQKNSIERQNSQLKKKVKFYYDFYRKNQPIGITISESKIIKNDSIKLKLDTSLYNYHPFYYRNNDMRMQGDTIWFNQTPYLLHADSFEIYLQSVPISNERKLVPAMDTTANWYFKYPNDSIITIPK